MQEHLSEIDFPYCTTELGTCWSLFRQQCRPASGKDLHRARLARIPSGFPYVRTQPGMAKMLSIFSVNTGIVQGLDD